MGISLRGSVRLGAVDGGVGRQCGADANSADEADDSAEERIDIILKRVATCARGPNAETCAAARYAEDQHVAQTMPLFRQAHTQDILPPDGVIRGAFPQLDGFCGNGHEGSHVFLQSLLDNLDFLTRTQAVQGSPGVLRGLRPGGARHRQQTYGD